MSSSEQTIEPSPWSSVWLKPRQTIERILAQRPPRDAILLGSLGAIAGTVSELIARAIQFRIFDWRIVVVVAAACAILGVSGLYIWALIIKWCGRLLGGRRSAADLRAVVAWGMTPNVLGLAIALVFLVVALATGMGLGRGPDTASDAASAWVVTAIRIIGPVCTVWSLVAFALMFSRAEGFGFWRTATACVLGWVLGLFLALLIAFGVRTALFQPYSASASSMAPTLLLGDNFFVSKYAYGYTRYSIPFSPDWFSGRILASEPARGDVVAFRAPNNSFDYIKRVVGLPGDRIQLKEGVLYINDAAVKREPVADFVGGYVCGGEPDARVKRWRETLSSGISYDVLDCVVNGSLDNTKVFDVPAGQYFVLGDNRDNSLDSRADNFGMIPLDHLIGRAAMIYFSAAPAPDGAASARPERMGRMIR